MAAEAKVTMADIPAVYDKLRASSKDGHFAVFMFMPTGSQPSDDAINVQLSVEGGRVGLDWVLLGSQNIRDKERFIQLAANLGYQVMDREMNGVKYLRVEDGGSLPRLCEATIRELYSISPAAELDLLPEGFAWP